MYRSAFLLATSLLLVGLVVVAASDEKCGRLIVSVSSMNLNIELGWNQVSCRPEEMGDAIRLYTVDPKASNRSVVSEVNIYGSKEGYYLTEVPFRNVRFPAGWNIQTNTTGKPGKHCLNFWAALYRQEQMLQVECLSIRPTWMKDLQSSIGNIPFEQLFLPGTHNSACYQESNSEDLVSSYIMTQDQSVYQQLVFGIRYLDLRIGYYKQKGRNGFYINHDLVRVTPLEPIINEIKRFLEKSPDEVIVLDLHRFPFGFGNNLQVHYDFVKFLDERIGHLATPKYLFNKGPTLNEIWRQKRRLIVCYGKDDIALNYQWLWRPLKQMWGNKQSVKDLNNYLEYTMSNHASYNGNKMWAAMAELTLTSDLIFFSFFNSNKPTLRSYADMVNRELNKWFTEKWAHQANIVATDFFLGNDLINIAIDTNKRKINI